MSPTALTIRPAEPADAGVWLEMRRALWPEEGDGTHAPEIDQSFAGTINNPLEVLIGFGTERITDGTNIDSFRLFVGTHRGF